MTFLTRHLDPFLDQATAGLNWLVEQVRSARHIVVKKDPHGGWIFDDGRAVPLHGSLEGSDVTALLDEREFLIVDLTLPIAAKTYIDDIIGSRIDLISPWTRENAVFGANLVSENATTVTITVAVSSKLALHEKIDDLKQLNPRSLTVQLATRSPTTPSVIKLPILGINSIQSNKKRAHISSILFTTLIAGGLLMSACFLATLYLDDERARIQSEIQSLRTSLGPQLSSGTTSHDPVQRMSDVKKNHWPMVELLAQLAATLPDDTFLDAVDINSSDIRIEGQSQNVAELPRILGQNAAFSEIAFKSPTIKREGVRGDLFELGIKIADRGERRP